MAASPQHATLVANTVATMTFDEDFPEMEIVNVDGAAAVYVRFGSTAPTVAGTGCIAIPATPGMWRFKPKTSGATVVKFISAGTPKVSARGVRP